MKLRLLLDVWKYVLSRLRGGRVPHLFAVAACVCALMGAYRFQNDSWRSKTASGMDATKSQHDICQQAVARYEPLLSVVSAEDANLFFVDNQHIHDDGPLIPRGRIFMARYAASPRRFAPLYEPIDIDADNAKYNAKSRGLRPAKDENYCTVVVDSDSPDSPPAFTASKDWTLVADYRNGLRVYQVKKTRN